MPRSESSPDRSVMAWLLVILAVGLSLRLVGLGWGLPYSFHPDEQQILTFSGQLSWSDLNPRFFLYPSLFIYQAAIVGWLAGVFGSGDPAQILLGLRLLSALYATATIGLVFLLGRRIGDAKVGLWAAALYAVLGNPVLHAHYGTTDSAVTALITAAVWLSIRAWQERSLGGQIGAAIIVGLATSTKYNAAVAGGVPLVGAWMTATSRRLSLAQRVGVALAIPAVAIVFLLATSPYIVLDYELFFEAQQSQIENQRFARAGYHQPRGAEEFSWAERGLVRNIPLIARDFTPIAILMVVYGLAMTAALPFDRRLRIGGSEIDPGSCLLLALWPLAGYLFMAPSALVSQRYMLPLYPVLAVYAGLGVRWFQGLLLGAHDRIAASLAGGPGGPPDALGTAGSFAVPDTAAPAADRGSLTRRWLAGGLAAALTVLLLVGPVFDGFGVSAMLRSPDTRIVAREWILENIPAGSGIAREQYSPPLSRSDGFRVLSRGFDLPDRGFDTYCAEGFNYFAVSSFHYEEILETTSEDYAMARSWYAELPQRGRLLRRFPGESVGFHNPTIEVYLLFCSGGED